MKKVYCFIGELNVDFQTEISQYLTTYCLAQDIQIYFFVNFDTSGANASYSSLEKKIITLPDLSDCDGVIIFPDSYAIPGMDQEVSDYVYEKADCPVVSIRVRDDRFYSIIPDDYNAITEMTEHFIFHHGFTRICFMAGRLELECARRRLKAYKDTMEKNGLEVTEGMIFYGDYWREKGDEAADWFISRNEEFPQAVVCANDYMAISVCNAFVKRGYDVPGDIAVSGLDDIEEVKFHIPPITSICASTESISRQTVEIFMNVWEGREQNREVILPLQHKYRNSCGCLKEIDYKYFQKLYNEKELYLSALNFSPYLGLEFENADSVDDLVYALRVKLTNKTFGNPDDYGTLFLCLCDRKTEYDYDVEGKLNFTEKMRLSAVVSCEEIVRPDVVFERREILPEGYRIRNLPMYIMSLHCKEYCYGYIVIQNEDMSRFNHLVKTLVFSLGNSFDRIRMLNENQTVREQSYVDELTGLPNRRSMERQITKLSDMVQTTGGSFCIMSLDMDGLKYINDNFGHLEGDFAISTTAHILSACKPEGTLVARTGGDEFIALIPSESAETADSYLARVYESLEECNRTSGRSYEFSVSAGYEFCRHGMNVPACIHTADTRMYENKKARKKNRV